MADNQEIFTVLDTVEGKNIKVEIIKYNKLAGSDSPEISRMLFYTQQTGLELKHVRITLNNGQIATESGALYFLKGNISMENKSGGAVGLASKLISGALTGEKAFKPIYSGTGEIYLEPSFGHYAVLYMDNEEIVVDKGVFYCCEPSIETGIAVQKNISSAVFGGEGFFQTKLKGTGICVLALPVPEGEILKYDLKNEKLQVDGNFAIMRSGSIEFSVEKSTKSLFGTLTSGEGLLQTFKGTGEVWLAPTQGVYRKMYYSGINNLVNPTSSSHTRT